MESPRTLDYLNKRLVEAALNYLTEMADPGAKFFPGPNEAFTVFQAAAEAVKAERAGLNVMSTVGVLVSLKKTLASFDTSSVQGVEYKIGLLTPERWKALSASIDDALKNF